MYAGVVRNLPTHNRKICAKTEIMLLILERKMMHIDKRFITDAKICE